MSGPQKDVAGECNARLYLADDYGDNTCTIRCRLPPDHEGKHLEAFEREGKTVAIEWEKGESAVCSECKERREVYLMADASVCYSCYSSDDSDDSDADCGVEA